MEHSYATKKIRSNRNIVLFMVLSPFIVIFSVALVFHFYSRGGVEAQVATGPSLNYMDNASHVTVNGEQKSVGTDIRGDGTITAVSGGVRYTSYSGERAEHYVNGATKPLWADNSSGWFAFDFTIHDQDNAWRVIEQEHEGDMSPTRALETSGSTLKMASRYGTPHVRGPDKSWNIKTVVPGERLQIVGYEKFGQGNAVFQGWWRKYGDTNWTQFANSTNFSMGYTSGNPGRYHKRGTYHGSQDYNSVSSVTWYGTALMYSSRSAAEAAAGISSSPTPSPLPPPPPPTPVPTPTPPPPAPAPSQSPYQQPIAIPGILQAENYDKGGQGIAYNDTTSSNQGGQYRTDAVDIENNQTGGHSIGFVTPGEWLEYTTFVQQSASYDITFRVAAQINGTGSWVLKEGSTVLATGSTGSTGGWYNWQNVIIKGVNLSGGNKVLRLESAGQAINLDYLTFTQQSPGGGATTPPAPAPTPPPPAPSPSIPTQPLPPIAVPGANPSTPVPVPTELPKNQDGTLVADFNGDGLNEVVKDTNNDGYIDPTTEVIIDGSTNLSLTDTTQAPIDPLSYSTLFDGAGNYTQNPDTLTFKAGPLPETTIPKSVAYSFFTAIGLSLGGVSVYLFLTKLSLLAGLRGRIGL